MPATIVLTAVPAHRRRAHPAGPATLVIAPFNQKLGMAVVTASTVEALAEAVANFSAMIHAINPDTSFCIAVRIRKGDSPPLSLKAAVTNGHLGQNRYVQTVDDGTATHQPHKTSSTKPSE